jgi:uncharacterized membrane protein YeaQ/YmgE (transglycosylase-associated protein family)
MSTTYILWYLIIGMVAGLVAGRVIRDRGLGLTGNLVVGIVGALIGGFLAGAIHLPAENRASAAVLAATLGSAVTLGIVAWLKNLALSR